MANPTVTNLINYVATNEDELICKSILKGDTISLINIQDRVVGPSALNLLDTDVVLQQAQCAWNSADDQVNLSNRTLNPSYLSVMISYCDKKLSGSTLQHAIDVKAGKTTLGFEEQLIGSIADSISKKLEHEVWVGKKADGANHFDGFVTILSGLTAQTGTGAYDALKKAYMALPEEAIDGVYLWISPAGYRQFIQELVSANLYHYNPEQGPDKYFLPGTSAVVKSTAGLEGVNTVYAIQPKNMFFGTNMAEDATNIDSWYSKDDREYRFCAEFVGSTQVAFPDMAAAATF